MTYRTEDEILADPDTEPSIKLRIIADGFGRALFVGLRRHHERLQLTDDAPPTWDDMTAWTRNDLWRPAIYDMLSATRDRFLAAGLITRNPEQ